MPRSTPVDVDSLLEASAFRLGPFGPLATSQINLPSVKCEEGDQE